MPFGLPKETIEQICCVLKNHPQVETVLLYGSRAKGNYKNGSDIDLTFTGCDPDCRPRYTLASPLKFYRFDSSYFSPKHLAQLLLIITRTSVFSSNPIFWESGLDWAAWDDWRQQPRMLHRPRGWWQADRVKSSPPPDHS